MFSPLQAEDDYVLNLANHDERTVCSMLVHLSLAEAGQTWLDAAYDGERMGELTSDARWLTDGGGAISVPCAGVLKLRYACEQKHRDMRCRRELARSHLGWQFDDAGGRSESN